MLAADSRTSFKSEVKQTIPKGFMENVLLNLPQLQVIDFDQADTFQIDLSFITYKNKYPKLQFIHLGDGHCNDEDIRRLCAACPNLKTLKGLGNMVPQMEGDALNVTWLHSCPELEEVDLSGCKALVDLRSFCHAPKLRILRAPYTNVYDLSSLVGCDLLELDVRGTAVTNAEFVVRLPNLKVLRVADTGILSMDWIADCNSLEEVDVSGCVHLKDFSAFAKNKTLKALVCRRSENLSAIDISDAIDTLDIVDCFKITDLSCLANKTNLKVLRVGGAYIKSIDWISSCINLEEVDVSGCFELNDLSPLGTLSKLHTLNLWCSGVNDIKWITNCTALHTLNIQWAKTADLSPIAKVPGLRKVRASGASECGWIADCQQLEEVDFSGSINLEDFSPLGSLPNLKIVNVSSTGVKKLGWLQKCTAVEELDVSWCVELESANEISYCTGLRVFRAFCSGIKEVSYIVRLENIERVEVYRCPLSNRSLEALAELKKRGVVLQLAFFAANTTLEAPQQEGLTNETKRSSTIRKTQKKVMREK
eukprot:gene7913-biopygen4846